MAKKKPKLTPNQLEYQRQLKLLKRREKSWEKKGYSFGVYIPYIPSNPSRVTKKDIQRIKKIQFKNFTKIQREVARKNYEYEHTPIDDNDFYDDSDYWFETDWHESPEPIKTTQEMDAWLEETFNEILNPSVVDREREGAREILLTQLETSKRELGVKGMYEYLQQPDVVNKLQTYASEYISSYQRKDGTDTGSTPLVKFCEVLNLGRPLTQEQNETLTMYGTIDLDYTDTDYDE